MPRPKMKKSGPSIHDEAPIWEYIYQNMCQRQIFEEVGMALFEAYLDDNESPWTAAELLEYYSKTMEPELYKASLEIEKILALYKQLEIPIEPHVEKMLEIRSGAGLRVDPDRCLIHYQFYNQPSNKRRPVPKSPNETVGEDETRVVPVETEEPIRKKVKTWPSPVKRVSEKNAPETSLPTTTESPVKNNPLKNTSRNNSGLMTPPASNHLPIATSTPAEKEGSRIPLDIEVSDEFNESIWNHVRENSATLSATELMSVEFWEKMLASRDMAIKSPLIVLRHFHANLLKKLWKQKLKPSIKMQLIKGLRLPMNRSQQRWLLENEGVDVELTEAGYVSSYEITEEEEKPAPKSFLPKQINTWVARNRPELPESDFDMPRESSQSRQHSATSRTQSVASHSHSMSGIVPKNEDDMTMERRRDKRVPFTFHDDVLAWKFILNQMYDPKTRAIRQEPVLPKGRSFWDHYIRKFNSPKTSSNWCSHYRKKMVGILHTMPFSRDTMLPLYTNLDIPITPDIHHTLENKFACKIKVNSSGVIQSYNWNSENVREQTIDTEPLVNDDEETDGESINANAIVIDSDEPNAIADEITKLSTASTTSLASTPHQLQPSTSGQHDPPLRKRKKSNDVNHHVKRRSQKLFEAEDEEEHLVPVVAAPTVATPTPVADIAKCKSRPSEKSRQINGNTSALSEDIFEIVTPEDESEPEEVLFEPLQLKQLNGVYMETEDLLDAIKSVVSSGKSDDNCEKIVPGVAKAFERCSSDLEKETIARYDIAQTIYSSPHGHARRGHHLHVFHTERNRLVVKTAEYCENEHIFRKRLAITTDLLDKFFVSINPPEPPCSLED